MQSRLTRRALVAGLAAALTACGGGGSNQLGGENTQSLTGFGSLGALIGSNCGVASANNPGATLVAGVTDSAGVLRVDVPVGINVLLVTCTGGVFYDEASDSQISLGTRSVRAVASGDRSPLEIAITPLTDLAARFVLNSGGAVTRDLVARTGQQISSFFGVEDLFDPPQIVDSSDDLNRLGGQAGVYAAVLAGLSDIGAARQTGGDAFTALETLRADFDADQTLGDDITRNEVDAATNNRAAGTGAAGPAAANQSEPDRNNGQVFTTGGSGGG